MNVIESIPKPITLFSRLLDGDVFSLVPEEGVYYMKMDGRRSDVSRHAVVLNSVVVATGRSQDSELVPGMAMHVGEAARVVHYPEATIHLGSPGRRSVEEVRATRRRRRKRRLMGSDEDFEAVDSADTADDVVNDEEER